MPYLISGSEKMKVVEKYNVYSILTYEVMLQHLQVITLKMIGHCIENNIKFNEEITNKIITNFLKQHYDFAIVSHSKAI